MNKPRIAVVGAANVDLCATPTGQYVPRDSCPGTLAVSYGGVGRNIAHNLVLMGCDVSLVTVFGDDDFALGLRRDCVRIGIDIMHSETIKGASSSIYVCINDERGEMMSAVSSMDICSSLTPEFVASRMDMLNACDAVVVEANMPAETIAYILDNCKVPVFADTVSTAKSHRVLDAFDGSRRFHTLKMNRLEAQELTGADSIGLADLEPAVAALHQMGADRVIITLGSHGLYYHDQDGGFHYPCEPVRVVSSNGAGDAFLAGIVLAYCNGLDAKATIRCALKASALAVQSPEAVNPSISAEYVLSE